jgi:peptidoglycan hydrolase-like protein with peptidoglycan-binding domain
LVFRFTVLGVVVCALACAATTTSTSPSTAKKKTAKKTVHSATAKTAAKTPAKTPAAKPGAVATKSKSGKSAVRPKRVVRSTQQTPTPERYKEIQSALIDKGYLQSEPTGEWGPDSVEALKRFQADENLNVDGKIGALSLIALGLGPKRLSAQNPAQPPAPQPPPSPVPAQQVQPPPPADPPTAQSHDSVAK